MTSKFYLKQRNNPQVGTYYVQLGELSSNEALNHAVASLYGSNQLHEFDSEEEYEDAIDELLEAGERLR